MDRGNFGNQTEDEFANFEPPDDPRKFPTLYTVQWLKLARGRAGGWRRDERLARSGRAARVRFEKRTLIL